MSSGDAMMEDQNGEDLFPKDNLFPVEVDAADARGPAPWHRPRKHWIRKLQWGKLANDLIAELHFDGRPFRYLTLPGKYFLDVRHLHVICAARDIQLRFVGFDTDRSDEAETNISADEISRLSHIHPESEVLSDRIESLAQPRSLAYERIEKCGDFDVINLDLCDSVASREAGANGSALDAIVKMIMFQSGLRSVPWLLFLTTRSDRGTVKQSVMTKLLSVLKENMDRNAKFKNVATRHAVISETKLAMEAQGQAAMDDVEFMGAFGIGFSKWLLKVSLTAWKVEQQITACYRVFPQSASPDMMSLAFRFERNKSVIVDRTGIAPAPSPQAQSTHDSEDVLAAQFIDGHRSVIDIDQVLYEDAYLRDEMINENADVMSQARFDREAMVEWGKQNCWCPAPQSSIQESS